MLQWFNVCIAVIVLLLLDLQAISFVLYPDSHQQLAFGIIGCLVFNVSLVLVVRWLLKNRSGYGEV